MQWVLWKIRMSREKVIITPPVITIVITVLVSIVVVMVCGLLDYVIIFNFSCANLFAA